MGRLTEMGEKSCGNCGWWDEDDGICTRIICKDYQLWKPRPEVEKKSILSDEPQDWRTTKEVEKP